MSNYQHGDGIKGREHPIYSTWSRMRRRCRSKKGNRAHVYYLRGITVADEWQDYLEFKKWALANGWRDGLQLDRIDNDLGYSPNNCRWVTSKENNNNRRNNKKYVFFGELLTASQAGDKYGYKYATICARIRKGATPNESVTRKLRVWKTKT